MNLFTPLEYQELNDGKIIYHPVNLYFNQEPIPVKKVKLNQFLFDHATISPIFNSIMNTWYRFDRNMAPILQHLIESIQPKKYFSKADFLIVIQALEGFHTRFRDKSKVDLRDRLRLLHEEFAFVPAINKIKIDYKIATDSRHYYSHFFHRSKKEHIADGEELFHLAKSLKIILICCILKETNFSNDIIGLIMKDYKKIL